MLVAGRYELAEELGRGGMGAVYRARDQSLERAVALKRLEAPEDVSQMERRRALFQREYRTLVELAHPHIVAAYDYGTDAQGPYYVMELLEGADMRELAPLPYPRACRYLREVATSLALLHARRLVHRDVTPRNVRLVGDRNVKLLDFGLLAAFGDEGDPVGTPPCIPPEALEAQPLDQRADLYALGALAYFMLTGKHAYPANDPLQLPTYWAQQLEPPSSVMPATDRQGQPLPALPRELDALVLHLLRLERLARPSSAGAIIDRLDVILADQEEEDEGKREQELAESYLASAPFVGRARELTVAKRAIADLARGRGAALMFEGGEGIGKSRLLRELALEAKLCGATVLSVDAELYDRPYAAIHALGRQLLEVIPSDALDTARSHAGVLGHVLPELVARLPGFELGAKPEDPTQWRTQLQLALRTWLLELSQRRPLVLAIDGVHACDDPSAVLVSSLAFEARHHPLLVLCTLCSGQEIAAPSAITALRQLSRVSVLSGVTTAQTRGWLEALFGDATNVTRLAQFLHERSAGNPARCMELLRFMVRNRDIRYRDGTWVLPTEPASLELPKELWEALLARLGDLSGDARSLAEELSMHRGALALDAGQMGACDELMRAGLLVAADDGHRFAHEALRDALMRGLSPERKVELHRRAAHVILARDELYVTERLEAALHLLHAGDERGARMLGETSLRLALGSEPMSGCQRTLEAALVLYREQKRDPYETAMLLAPLGMAAYLVDRRLDRHGDALIEHFERLSGLSLARRLRPFLGKRIATYAGLVTAAVRYVFLPKRLRYSGFSQFVQALTSGLLGLAGKAAVCLDGPAVARVANALEPLSVLGSHSTGAYAYDYARGLCLITQDRYAQTHAHFLELERRMRAPEMLRDVSQEARQIFLGGVHYALGVLESFLGDSKVLERATLLEQSGIDIHALIAAQLRLQYHGFRGETEPLRHAFAQMEASAIHAGHTWQVETWAAIAVNLFGGLWHDVIITKRSLDETERLMLDVPSLARYAASSKATYLLQRGEPRECAEVYETLLARERPLERIGWSVSSGLLAEAYNQLGEHARARQICEQVLAVADPLDALYSGLRLSLEIPFCNALCALSDHAAAEARLERLFALYTPRANPLALGALHEVAARVAFAQKDRKTFTQHLKQVEALFCPLGNPALIARFRNLAELGGSEGGMAATIAAMRETRAFETALSKLGDRKLAARHLLSWVMERYEGYVGYLFAQDAQGPAVLAATAEIEPREEIFALVHRTLATLGKKEDTTMCGTGVLTTPDHEGAAHVYLLSYLSKGTFYGEGALVLVGRAEQPPKIRYELLQAAAQQLRRLRPGDLAIE
jgi:hypothetical protein